MSLVPLRRGELRLPRTEIRPHYIANPFDRTISECPGIVSCSHGQICVSVRMSASWTSVSSKGERSPSVPCNIFSSMVQDPPKPSFEFGGP